MPASRSRSASERAEARRRKRQVARGEETLPEETAMAATATARPPSLLTRLFPPAPPLPGKGDPLAGFTYRGRFRGYVAGAWLLARHPLTWGVAAVGWAVLQLALLVTPRENLVAFAITLAQYGLLIGAGWFGWWRPWLFGTAAGVLGVIFHALLAGLITIQAGEGLAAASGVVASLTALVVLYGLVGAFAGFYGGYLRRRMATQSTAKPKSKRR
ncbi:MAG TPA: hypothetical protein VFP83_08460 [Candidatus Limnocylindria bacterium]|nr:hypothetical protein [Candidatus Limnocylindria bacterium]